MPTTGPRTSAATRRAWSAARGPCRPPPSSGWRPTTTGTARCPPRTARGSGLVAQAGIAAFIEWYRDPVGSPHITADVFGTAPRELTRSISLSRPSTWSAR